MSSHTPEDLGPFPKVNPRDDVINKVKWELDDFTDGLQKKYQLSSAEFLFILTHALYNWSARIMSIERRQTKVSPEKDV